MAKITLTDLASLTNETSAIATLNANWALIEAAFENTLSRDGTAVNTMEAQLDMNSNSIINLATSTEPSAPVLVGDVSDYVPTIYLQASEPATTGATGSLWIDSDSTDLDLYQLSGATWTDSGVNMKGSDGAAGVAGADGADGNDGAAGADGTNGTNGTDGVSFVWEGTWVTATAYQINDVLRNSLGNTYIATADHTSGASTEPGIGASWATVWDLFVEKGAAGAGSGDLEAVNNLSDVASAATSRTNLGLAIGSDVQAHSAVLDATTASFTTADETKLDGVEASATADQTGAEIKAAYEAEADTNAFDDAAVTKLAGIETGADVTDTANVTAAGALMDSEVDADIKTLVLPASTTISTFGATLVDDADAATSRTTLGLGDASTLDEATTADWRQNNADHLLSTDQVWSAMAEVSLTDAATVALDMDNGFDFTVTLGGNRTLGNATNTKVGQRGRIRVVQDGTGSRTLSFASNYEFAGGTAVTLSTTAADEDILYYDVISATRIVITSVLDIS